VGPLRSDHGSHSLPRKIVTQNLYTALENCHGLNNVILPILIINLDIILKVTSGFKI